MQTSRIRSEYLEIYNCECTNHYEVEVEVDGVAIEVERFYQ